MSRLYEISGCANAGRKADVVFIHGLGGDAFKTWRHAADESSSWPHSLGQEFREVGVWSLGYAASPTKWLRFLGWFGHRWRDAGHSMALPDRALQVLDLMVQRGLGQRPLLFICHSLGGLVAKQILRKSADASEPRPESVFKNTRAVLFLATPHAGAQLASLGNAFRTVFRTTISIEDLRAHDAHLRDLFDWYRRKAEQEDIRTVTYYELRALKGVTIVNPTSAHPGVGADPVGLDEDHLSIAKPREPDAQVCGAARKLLQDCVLAPRSALPVIGKVEAGALSSPATRHIPFDRLPAIRAGALIGRDAQRDELAARLGRGEDACVFGPAGFGKTALAADAIRVAIGEKDEDLARSPFPDGLVFLDLYRLKAEAEKVWNTLAERFAPGGNPTLPPRERAERACAKRRALLVVEGAEEARDGATLLELLSALGTQMRRLVLTRNAAQDFTGHGIRLDQELSRKEARALLRKLSPTRGTDTQLEQIVTLLGGHPLALTNAGCQLAQPEDSVEGFLADLRAAPLVKACEPGNERHPLRWTYERSWRLIPDDARQVLVALGWLGYAPVTLGAAEAALGLASLAQSGGEGRGEGAGQRPRDALRHLVRQGFLSRPGDADRWQFSHALAYRYAFDRAHSLSRTEGEGRGEGADPLLFHLADWVVTEFTAALAPFKRRGEHQARNVRSVDDALVHFRALLAADTTPGCRLARQLLALQHAFPMPGQTVLVRPHLEEAAGLLYARLKPLLDEGPDADKAHLARLAANWSLWLSELGRRDEALSPAQEAVEIRRALARQNPDAFQPHLASSLNNLAILLSERGWRGEALGSAQEAVELHRALARQNPSAFQPHLAKSLNNLATFLSELGRRGEALGSAHEAVELYRALAGQNPDAFQPDLAGSLNNLANRMSDLGGREEALDAAQEAVALYRALAGQNPDAFQPHLASSLNTLAVRLSELGRRGEALGPAQEAAELYRALARQNPDAFQPDLALSLNNLANVLSELGLRREALGPAQEAVELYRALARQNPDAFQPALAGSLNNLSIGLSELGQRGEALGSAREAVALYRALAGQNPDAFQPGLALSLNNLAIRLSERGRHGEALGPAQELVELCRALARRIPDAFQPHLAMALNTLANVLSKLGRRSESLGPAQEVVELCRALARKIPDAFQPHLASSLNNLAIRLRELGRREEALGPAQEAVELYRALARQNPDAFQPELAKSLGMIGQTLEANERREEALASLAEGVGLLAPHFQSTPEAFAPPMRTLVGEYQRVASALGQTPDQSLLNPVLETLDRIQAAPAAGVPARGNG